MKKKLAASLAALILTLAGCSADTTEGITEQSEFLRHEAQRDETASGGQNEAGDNTGSAFFAAQSVEAQTTEPDISAKTDEPDESEEPGEKVDPVKLVEMLGGEYLGLPESGRVYIYRNRNEQREINAEPYYGVSCYDEGEALKFICDIWVNADGSRAYRQYGEEYRLLPESQTYSGFDPEIQIPADIFFRANALYAAAYGELPYDQEHVGFTSELGNYCRVTGELDTRRKLNEALERFFSGEILMGLTPDTDNVKTDKDGALYVLEHSGGNISYLGTDYTLTELTEDKAVFTGVSRFEYEAGSTTEKAFTCTAVKTSNGWRFTKFTPPY